VAVRQKTVNSSVDVSFPQDSACGFTHALLAGPGADTRPEDVQCGVEVRCIARSNGAPAYRVQAAAPQRVVRRSEICEGDQRPTGAPAVGATLALGALGNAAFSRQPWQKILAGRVAACSEWSDPRATVAVDR
jgi:hypothetical protein